MSVTADAIIIVGVAAATFVAKRLVIRRNKNKLAF